MEDNTAKRIEIIETNTPLEAVDFLKKYVSEPCGSQLNTHIY